MQERRRRLIKYLYKKEGKLDEFEEGFHQSISKKSTIIKKFSSVQLEDLLRTSTKNVAQEVVSSLIPPQGGHGVLSQVEKYCQVNNISPMVQPPTSGNQYDMSNQAHAGGRNGNQHMASHGSGMNAPKQRLKSATMSKRINRGYQNDDNQYDDNSNQQYSGYTGHMSNTDMPSV